MPQVGYFYLTEAKPVHKSKNILSSERMLHKDCDLRGSVPKIKLPFVSLKGLGTKTN
jgi:hypothetical protein